MSQPKKLLWIDLETTGLVAEKCVILEVAVAVTTTKLEILDEFQALVYQTGNDLLKMDDYCTKMHTSSGLVVLQEGGYLATQESARYLVDVERKLISFVTDHGLYDKIVVHGNSIGALDVPFLKHHMPEFAKRLHYRVCDVSSFKEYFVARYGLEPPKKLAHRAMSDVYESVDELRFYAKYIKAPELEET